MNTDELMQRLSEKKAKSLKELESLRRELLQRFDKRIDDLYKKRDYFAEVWKNKALFRKERVGVWKKIRTTTIPWNFRYLLSMPFIYMMFIPAIILHVFVEVYQHICFPLYGIQLVKPKGYFIFDRKNLPYLNWFEKFNCFYCSYFNGLIAYVMEIAAQTERYWCPIKHARRRMIEHSQYARFVDYDDAKNVRKEWARLRKYTNVQEKEE